MWDKLFGGAITVPDCGSIDLPGSSPQAAFFRLFNNSKVSQYIRTKPLDLRKAQYALMHICLYSTFP